MTDVLQRILATKREEVAAGRRERPLAELRSLTADLPAPRPFRAALAQQVDGGGAAVIAEIKRASPSAGLLRDPFDVAAIARSYRAGGAACLSVLTDRTYFQGHAQNLRLAREAVSLPALRKDFIVDPWQVYESRALGADALLLIVAALDQPELTELLSLSRELGLDALVEVHDEHELSRALDAGAELIGINNRNLRTFVTDIDVTLRLAPHLPARSLAVTESGIRTVDDVARLRGAGVHAFLVGEAFMRAADPGAALEALFE